LGFLGFRITEPSGIGIFGIQDSRTSGFYGIHGFLGSRTPPYQEPLMQMDRIALIVIIVRAVTVKTENRK
jgi:hypothetical protein